MLSLILRSRRCADAASCAFAYLVFSSTIAYWDAFIAHNTDPKFQSTPLVPFEIGLAAGGVIAAIFGLSFWLGTSIGATSRRLPPLRMRLLWAVVVAAIGSFGDRVLYSFLGTSAAYGPVAWVWTMSFPFTTGYVLGRSRSREYATEKG